jgi:predicted dehydrogenase
MGRRHTRVFSGEAGFDLVGIYDVHPDRALAAAVACGTLALDAEDDAIELAELVVIATPISAHAPSARRALEASCELFVEKPLCARAHEALALADLAASARRGLWVGHSERFNPVIRALRSIVPPEAVRSVAVRRLAPPSHKPVVHPAVLDLGVHDLDLVAFLTGARCELRRARPLAGARGEAALLDVVTASGALGRVHVDRTAAERRRTIVLHTDDEVFHGDLLAPRLVRTSLETGKSVEVTLDLTEPLVAQARALLDALVGAPSPCATASDGARAVLLAERASAAVTRGVEDFSEAEGSALRKRAAPC